MKPGRMLPKNRPTPIDLSGVGRHAHIYDDALDYFEWIPRGHLTVEQQEQLSFLEPLKFACRMCKMCRLGMKIPVRNGHRVTNSKVFSNMVPSKFMIIGQNPGYLETVADEPFVGASGDTFHAAIKKHGLTRDHFYITNLVKCLTENAKPEYDEIEACSTFLKMEIQALRPKFVITLGAAAYEAMGTGVPFADGLGTLTESSKFDVKIFAIYHPSPLSLENDPDRARDFKRQIAVMCALVKSCLEPQTASTCTSSDGP